MVDIGSCLLKMPFTWWVCSGTDVNYRRRLEQKMCLAKETPEPIFDLSGCNLSEVPPGVFSMCRVFRKEVLLLQENQLSSLHSGGNLQDLYLIKVLDLHSNRITQLPDDIKHLKNLGVLNLENNRLRKLPDSLSCLTKLHTLNLKGNKFKDFPRIICKLGFLQVLDITNNHISILPTELCLVRTLQTLTLDAYNFREPPPDICTNGTQSIMEYLCLQYGTDYIPPSKCLAELQEQDLVVSQNISPLPSPVDDLMDVNRLYEQKKLQRRQDLLQYESALQAMHASQQQIAAEVLEQRQRILEEVTQEQDRLQEEIEQMQVKKEKERKRLLNSLEELEDHSTKLIDQLLALNEKAKNSEALLEQMERDRLETEELFSIKQEELEKLQRNDVLAAMQEILEAEERQRIVEKQKQEGILRIRKLSPMENEEKLKEILSNRERDQRNMMTSLVEEEDFQRKAFHALQVCRDLRHLQIAQQIKLIEKELTSLTSVELKKRDLKIHTDMNKLSERRSQLAELLAQLQVDKEKREQELKERLNDMEMRRKEEMKDYWLLQYQKLMDRKPDEIAEAEIALDPTVKEILYEAGAKNYVILFAMKHVTLDELLSMTEKDLVRLGVTSSVVRESILSVLWRYGGQQAIGNAEEGGNEQKTLEEESSVPTAPSPDDEEEEVVTSVPSAPLEEPVHRLWIETECVVCLDKRGSSVFIPCGHVCCCWPCAQSISTCPMCRTAVEAKFLLTMS